MGRPIFLDSDLVREGMSRSGETVTMSVMRNDDLRRTLAETRSTRSMASRLCRWQKSSSPGSVNVSAALEKLPKS